MKPHRNGAGHGAGPKCGAKTRAGGTCNNAAGFKTAHPGIGRCAFHGGATPSHERAATMELARRECVRLGIPLEGVSPEDALMAELAECLGNVAFYRERVQNLGPDPSPDEFVLGADGGGHWRHGEPGLWGRTYHISGVPTGEARAHIWLELYNEERRYLAHLCAEIVKLKVGARQLQLAERDAAAVFTAIERTFAKLGLGDFERFRDALGDELHAVNRASALPAGA